MATAPVSSPPRRAGRRRARPPLAAIVAVYAVVIAVCFGAGVVVGRLLL